MPMYYRASQISVLQYSKRLFCVGVTVLQYQMVSVLVFVSAFALCQYVCMSMHCATVCVMFCMCVRTCVFSIMRLLYPVTLSHLSWCPAVFPAAS